MAGLTFLLIVVCLGATGLQTSEVFAQNPAKYDFGGRVTWIFPCVNGLWVINSVPKPMSVMYVWGLSGIKRWGPPYTVGQLVLGSASGYMPCLFPCFAGLCPIGFGMVVWPNAGSSPGAVPFGF